MKYIYNILIIFAILINSFALDRSSSHCQIITKTMIYEAGLIRVSDIFSLIEDWNIATIGGFKWLANSNGLSSV